MEDGVGGLVARGRDDAITRGADGNNVGGWGGKVIHEIACCFP